MKIHELKIQPCYFDDIIAGKKHFEIRKNDRAFMLGDVLVLKEWLDIDGFTGRKITRIVGYITDYRQPKGQVVMGFERTL